MVKKIIITIDGSNNVGKTTLINNLTKSNSLFSKYALLKTELLDDPKWWFEISTPMELINEICRCLDLRNDMVKESSSRVVLLDKGVKTIEARIYATLKYKNVHDKDIKYYLECFRKKCASLQNENINILLENETIIDSCSDYYMYDIYQKNYLKSIKFDRTFFFNKGFPNKQTEDEIVKTIYDFWLNTLVEDAIDIDINIIALAGLSECGKSSVGKYLGEKYNVWNLKLKFFHQILRDARLVEENNIFYYLIYVEELLSFFNIHYYKQCFSIESFYDFKFLSVLRTVFKDNFKLIYIDAEENLRLERSLVNRKVLEQKDKYKQKKEVDQLKEFSDFIVNNNGDIYYLFHQIDDFFLKDYSYAEKPTKQIDELKIDISFKKILLSIEKDLKNKFSELLLLFSVVGSCGSETAILGWSDIDIFIIVEKISHELLLWIKSLNDRYDIHIGVNCFDISQINKMKIDLKCKWYLYYIQIGRIKPCFVRKSLITKKLSFSMLVNEETFYDNELRFAVNRLLIEDADTKKIFKNTVTLIKIQLRKKGFICITLEEIFEKLYEVWKIDINQYITIVNLPNIDSQGTKAFAELVLKNV